MNSIKSPFGSHHLPFHLGQIGIILLRGIIVIHGLFHDGSGIIKLFKQNKTKHKINSCFSNWLINFLAFYGLTCEADWRLEPFRLFLPLTEVGVVSLICLRYSTSLKIFLSPPAALCLTLSNEPILLLASMSIFWLTI